MPDVQKAIQAMIQSLRATEREPAKKPARPVICISRDYGSAGDEIARKLAERLGLEVYDAAIVNRISERAHADPEAMKALDEGAEKARSMWLYSLLTGQDLSRDTYRRHLVNVLLGLGRMGGVIVGRGAHIVLARQAALRARIVGTTEHLVQRVAAAEGMDEKAARKRVESMNHERGKFVWDTFGARLNDPTTFDVSINTDKLGDIDVVVEMLLSAKKSIVAAQG